MKKRATWRNYFIRLIVMIIVFLTLGFFLAGREEYISILTLGLFICAIYLAIESLAEANKTRRDMFLPIIISRSYSTEFAQRSVGFLLQNAGHGVALYSEMSLIDIQSKRVVATSRDIYPTPVYRSNLVELMDHRQAAQYYHGIFKFKDRIDAGKIGQTKLKLKIVYRDCFDRSIESLYKLELQRVDGNDRFWVKNLELKLPQ